MNSTTIAGKGTQCFTTPPPHNTAVFDVLIQKHKQIEEEFNQKLAELRAELGFSNDLRHKLERKVTCLENENNLLENKQKELEGTIQGLLESKEAFVKAYEDSTYEMKRAIEDRERKIVVLYEKLKAHLLLFGSISKEASSINKLMDDARHALRQKEDRDVSTKELLLQNLISENKGLRSEVGSLGIAIKKIQNAVTRMSEEDRKTFTSLVKGQEECQLIRQSENLSVTRQQIFTNTLQFAKAASPKVQEDSIKSPLKKDKINCCALEANTSSTLQLQSVYSSSPSACSVRQCDTDNASLSAAAAKDDYTELVNQLDSECSTTQVEIL
ncbi:hypothetical protein RND71_003058 [Anisodus tanguticus]|uniref:Uncharacterized protein n=1 Tax=Anisodus tanguticus TaxID=243964 RepID=A0AAE1VPM6_9SOLA|nr:hypothetical protein RND71_003058 [Anisodus tanguticus]